MSASDPRDRVLSSIDTSKLRVKVKSAPTIFLCGGPLESVPGARKSIRKEFMDHLSDNRLDMAHWVQCAEDIQDWSHDSVYADLKTFETHIAEIADITVLILESPGSLAELGMFSENSSLNKNLLVFVDACHYNKRSFIKDGPLKYLEIMKTDRVFRYHIGQGSPAQYDENYIAHVYSDINDYLENLDRDVKFDTESEGHVTYLIVSLIWIFHALTQKEIIEYLGYLGIDLAVKQFRQLVFTAQNFKFIRVEDYSSQRFFVPGHSSQKIDLFSSSEFLEKKSIVEQFYESDDKQSKRRSVLKRLKIGS